ncbi:hypothetical protein P8452_42390 [Trifolium repens]|nr:hypothetical protein P8452_42390 [Trifolium repens]
MASSSAAPAANPTQPSPSAAPAARVHPKNAAGNKSDIAWQYAISIDEKTRKGIKAHFKGVARSYQQLWDIIDARWDKQLHRPLHLGKKKIKRKSASYDVEDIDSEDEGEEWIENVEDEENGEDDGGDVGQDASIGDVLGDDLDLPPIDEEDGDLDDDVVAMEENEDEDGDLDDYQDFGLENILNI